ncbi:MAG: type II secretion system F family protein [Nanoarchaeota archaeon]|nr:type II secretion system F family protein [Nanoarchaeota archaeon]
MTEQEYTKDLKIALQKQVKAIRELTNLLKSSPKPNSEEKRLIDENTKALYQVIRKTGQDVTSILEDMTITKPLPVPQTPSTIPVQDNIGPVRPPSMPRFQTPPKKFRDFKREIGVTELEKKIIKRLKKKKPKVVEKKMQEPSGYVRISNKFFAGIAKSLNKKQMFITLKRDLIKANIKHISGGYVAMILFTTMLAAIAGLLIFIFLLFFSFSIDWPIITMFDGEMKARMLNTFWIIFLMPIATFLLMYSYPSMERKHTANKIDQELPFATIHMSAISASLVEPSKIFSIILSTKEYPNLEKEFTKLLNEINVYGYDLVTALRNVAFNNPSQKLAELFNGLATTINSGGDLPTFFDKRAQTLLFDYRLERERYTKTAETFMDIYISLVIAAPMILMLLLIMMRVSGLGVALSTGTITLMMILGVSMINVLFLVFLQLKQPTT